MSKDNPSNYFELEWSSNKGVPAVGTLVSVKINSIGVSKVLKYFVEHGFLGMIVKPLSQPPWYIKQNGADAYCHVYASECEELRMAKEEKKLDVSKELG